MTGRLCATLVLGFLLGCGVKDAGSEVDSSAPQGLFRDVTSSLGLNYESEHRFTGRYELPEIMGSGLAVFDADGDGRLDVYVLSAGAKESSPNCLFLRNEGGGFRKAVGSGLEDPGHGTGVAVGDVDNDGDVDVYVGNWGEDHLYLNDGSGHFRRSAQRGFGGDAWTTSVAMFDADGDGFLDIWAVHYVEPDPKKACSLRAGARDFCSPKVYRPVADALYRNRGDGTFEDVSRAAGLTTSPRNGLGITVSDFNRDGRPDVFVANDGQANQLWVQQENGRFEDQGMLLGCAVNGEGASEASMGVALGDVDRDGDLDLFMTHLVDESHTLYIRDESGGFTDATATAGLQTPSLRRTGFGTVFLDVDLDGALDLAVVNGRVSRGPLDPSLTEDSPWSVYAERNQLFRGDGRGAFADLGDVAGDFGCVARVSRALVPVDLDDDGDLDLLVTNTAGPLRAYENLTPPGHFLKVWAKHGSRKRTATGARVVVVTDHGRFPAEVGTGASYLSSWDTPLHFGLGSATKVSRIDVVWPGGTKESFGPFDVNTTVTLVTGEGR
ncbi:MAG TPA: CRTAC1 family protein [Planctomycetes bacterium]|nr:CRTAC1 family protein [Planctomycetota bacterium]